MAGEFFHRSEDIFLVGLARGDQLEENSGKFVGRGCDGCGSPEPTSQAADVMPQVGLPAIKRLRCHAESHGEATNHFAGPHEQDLTATDPVVQIEIQPRGKGSCVRELVEIRAQESIQVLPVASSLTWP